MNGTTRVNQGDGNAKTTLMAGTIHNVYGGSNTNGDIRGEAIIVKTDNTHTENQDDGCCDKLVVNKMYSAGKDADISGGSKVILGCMEDDWIEEYYGGAENANVLGDVELTITSGKFRKVFGGNKTSGAIFGHIKVNIEETGCIPIEIDNCNTDLIIPARYLAFTTRDPKFFGEAFMHDLRYDANDKPVADFVMNQPEYSEAPHEGVHEIIVGGKNWGSGSSREHAAWAIAGYGVRVTLTTAVSGGSCHWGWFSNISVGYAGYKGTYTSKLETAYYTKNGSNYIENWETIDERTFVTNNSWDNTM
jgi:hypothetical protein